MAWWGKLVGGAFGFMVGGPLGAALGAALGHQFDKGLNLVERLQPGDQERVQTAFFTATFSVMGAVAKADGKVTHDEIKLAETVMTQMQLSAEMRRVAINLFNQGKDADFRLEDVLEQFRQECHRRQTLKQMFIEIQLQAAFADGDLHSAEEALLLLVCEQLGFSISVFRQLEAMVRAGDRINAGGQRTYDRQRTYSSAPGATLPDAYTVLGIEKTAKDAEVKRAYRRLMSQHHPDKLVAKGLPDEMIELAKQKTQKIRQAYDQVKESRGMR